MSNASRVREQLEQMPPQDIPRSANLVEIALSTDQKSIVDQAELALAAAGGVHVRARGLVHVVRDRGGAGWLSRELGTPIISRLKHEHLRELMGSAATWIKYDKHGVPSSTMVPPWVPKTLAERDEWSFPPLEGISDTPVMRPDGTIHTTPGYDPVTRVIFDPAGVVWPIVKQRPTHADAVTALAELAEPFTDFPFREPCDRSAIVALTCSIVARSAITGCVPMFSLGATTPGSGKGLGADAASVISTGRAAPKMAPTSNDDEMRKRLLAIGIEAPQVVVIDNIDGEFGCPSLDSALTAGCISDRILGVSETKTVPLTAVFVATGNNIQYRGDLARRVVPIDLDPACENPEDRDGFRHADLLGYVRAERPRLVVAALTLLRAYCIAGKPPHNKPAKGSFESWDRLVRGAIIWAGGADPLGGTDRLRANGDSERDKHRALLAAWRSTFTEIAITAPEILDRAAMFVPLQLAIDAYGRTGVPMDARTLAKRLRKIRGRIVDGHSLEEGDMLAHGGLKTWKVVPR